LRARDELGGYDASFMSVRTDAYGSDFVSIIAESSGYYFMAQVDNAYYSCTVPASLTSMAAEAAVTKGWFYVTWGSNGQCTGFEAGTDSAYGASW